MIHFSSVAVLTATFIKLCTAFLLGAAIGFERQMRQRTAGLRTNTLVAVGAAIFVALGSRIFDIVGGSQTPIHIVAYVVSGIGFLGAGAIMKEGASISGLNTAATLWGSGAVGACCGFGLLAYNLLMLPLLWTGVWGSWGLGWLDTALPAIVPWAATGVFIVVGFAGLAKMSGRKAVALTGVFFVLVALPVYVLTVGGDAVGANLQPRYLLPLIVLFAMLLVTMPAKQQLSFTRLQLTVILGALAVANLVALQINIRRYVTGAGRQGINLDAGAEWWWPGLPIAPTALWIIGSLAYLGVCAMLWKQFRVDSIVKT